MRNVLPVIVAFAVVGFGLTPAHATMQTPWPFAVDAMRVTTGAHSTAPLLTSDRPADGLDWSQSLDPEIFQRFGCVRGKCNRH